MWTISTTYVNYVNFVSGVNYVNHANYVNYTDLFSLQFNVLTVPEGGMKNYWT